MIASQSSVILQQIRGSTNRVVLLTPSLARGGAEVIVAEVARAFKQEGWEVSVVSMMEPSAFRDELERSHIRVVSLGMRPGHLNMNGLFQLLLHLRRFQPSLIHAHMFHANILARIAGALVGIPVVCTIHNILESSRRKDHARLRELAYRLTDWLCVRTTAISELVRNRYVRDGIVREERIETIPNFVDSEIYQAIPEMRKELRVAMKWEGRFVWLAVGRLEQAKDYPNLIAAFQKTKRDIPSSHLVIAGEGCLRGEIESLLRNAGLKESVSMLGERSDVPNLMMACDGFVLASAWEGMPLVLLEAASCECLCVTTDVGGSREIVRPGLTGFVIPPGNPQRLGEVMTEAAGLAEDDRRRLGAAARRHVVLNYSKALVFRRYAQLYEEILASPRNPQ
jgi:glycosyltransferase involved in cell wall biosynthesis